MPGFGGLCLHSMVLHPTDPNRMWTAISAAGVFGTSDGGRNWTSVENRLRGTPANTWVAHIEASPHDAGTAFAILDDHRRSNWTPYVLRTDDFGRTWRNLATRDVDGYCLAIEQDPVNENLLFLGTEFGLYVSLDGGGGWFARPPP